MIVEISVTERIDRTLQNDRKRASRSGICCRRHTCGSASRSARSHGTRRPCSSQRARDRRIDRYYDPSSDQFLSIDPDVATTGQPYSFTGDDPLNATDPLGLHSVYVLMRGGKIFYVGRSKNLPRRIDEHISSEKLALLTDPWVR